MLGGGCREGKGHRYWALPGCCLSTCPRWSPAWQRCLPACRRDERCGGGAADDLRERRTCGKGGRGAGETPVLGNSLYREGMTLHCWLPAPSCSSLLIPLLPAHSQPHPSPHAHPACAPTGPTGAQLRGRSGRAGGGRGSVLPHMQPDHPLQPVHSTLLQHAGGAGTGKGPRWQPGGRAETPEVAVCRHLLDGGRGMASQAVAARKAEFLAGWPECFAERHTGRGVRMVLWCVQAAAMRDAHAASLQECRLGRMGASSMGKRLRAEQGQLKTCDEDRGGWGWWGSRQVGRPALVCDQRTCAGRQAVQQAYAAMPSCCILHACCPTPFCPPAGGCGRRYPVHHVLRAAPRLFSLQLSWLSTRESGEDIAATLRALDEHVSLGTRSQWARGLLTQATK